MQPGAVLWEPNCDLVHRSAPELGQQLGLGDKLWDTDAVLLPRRRRNAGVGPGEPLASGGLGPPHSGHAQRSVLSETRPPASGPKTGWPRAPRGHTGPHGAWTPKGPPRFAKVAELRSVPRQSPHSHRPSATLPLAGAALGRRAFGTDWGVELRELAGLGGVSSVSPAVPSLMVVGSAPDTPAGTASGTPWAAHRGVTLAAGRGFGWASQEVLVGQINSRATRPGAEGQLRCARMERPGLPSCGWKELDKVLSGPDGGGECVSVHSTPVCSQPPVREGLHAFCSLENDIAKSG